jgi:hypothetical protein
VKKGTDPFSQQNTKKAKRGQTPFSKGKKGRKKGDIGKKGTDPFSTPFSRRTA